MRRKMICLALVLCLMLWLLPAAFADEEPVGSKDGFSYAAENGEITILSAEVPDSGKLVIPSSIDGIPVTDICDYAFKKNHDLKSVVLPDGLLRIGTGSFMDCDNLSEVTLPDSVAEINPFAFNNTALYNNADNWSNGALYIGHALIQVDSQLRECIIRPGTVTIASQAFGLHLRGALNVEGNFTKIINIPDSVKNICHRAFICCWDLEEITIPEGVKSLHYGTFADCKSLVEVHLPDSLETIDAAVFGDCVKLEHITVPEGVSFINHTAFEGCTAFTEILTSPANRTYASVNGVLMDKSQKTLVLYPIGRTGDYSIPEGVETVGDFAFENHERLSGVSFPSSVKTIGENAFRNCTGLQELSIPSSVSEIGSEAFNGCSGIHSLTISPGVSKIGNGAFENCTSLDKVALPSSVSTIGMRAFRGCSSLAEVALPSGIRAISSGAFNGCSSLAGVELPSSVRSIGTYAFSECTALTGIVIPSSVKSIGSHAFSDCTALRDIQLDSKATALGIRVFENTAFSNDEKNWDNGLLYYDQTLLQAKPDLSEVKFRPKTEIIAGGAFMGCEKLTEITVPKTVKNIGAAAFRDCHALKKAVLPDGIERIRSGMFYGCDRMVEITIPVSVKEFESDAFGYCSSLREVYYGGTLEQWEQIKKYDYSYHGSDEPEYYDGLNWIKNIHCGKTPDTPAPEVTPTPAPKQTFQDVGKDAYYAEPVKWAVENGITNGTSENTFSPNAQCTRAQVVTFLWRANGSPKAKGSNPFKDVKKTDYFYDAVLWAVANGITNGTSENTFSPGASCTRGQVVTFQWRANSAEKATAKNPFKDVQTKEYYYDAVLWAVNRGVTNGTSQNTFSPNDTCTRGQVVTFLYRDIAK